MSFIMTLFPPRWPESRGFFMIFDLIIHVVVAVNIVEHYSVSYRLYWPEVVSNLSMRGSYLSECFYL